MAGPAILIPFALKLVVRAAIAGKITWAGVRLYQNDGDVPKTLKVMKDDVVHTFMFLTDSEHRNLKKAGDTLKEQGGDFANIAGLLLSLAETVTGTKLGTAKQAVEKAGQVISAYNKLSPIDKAAANAAADQDIETTLNEALARYLRARGIQMIGQQDPALTTDSERLSRHYYGLYLIGRSGNKFCAEDVDSMAPELLRYHEKIDHPGQELLIAWYKLVGISALPNTLAELLAHCPEVKKLNVDARYIAYALNQPQPDLSFDGITDEFEKHLL